MHPKQILRGHGLRPKKSLGQNFLFDDAVLAQIAGAADLEVGDNVLEIGAGLGALTGHLARRAGRVVAVELDDRLLPILHEQLGGHDNVAIVHGDILDLDPVDWFGDAPYKVVANVPYYITGAILRHLLSGHSRPALIVLTVQKEVAERITAVPPNMSLLAVSVQVYGRPTVVASLKAGAFWPRPDVDSAVLRIDLNDQPPVPPAEADGLLTLARVGFSQKRKQLQKNLRALDYGKQEVRATLQEAGIDPRRRAETLSLDEWAALLRMLRAQ